MRSRRILGMPLKDQNEKTKETDLETLPLTINFKVLKSVMDELLCDAG